MDRKYIVVGQYEKKKKRAKTCLWKKVGTAYTFFCAEISYLLQHYPLESPIGSLSYEINDLQRDSFNEQNALWTWIPCVILSDKVKVVRNHIYTYKIFRHNTTYYRVMHIWFSWISPYFGIILVRSRFMWFTHIRQCYDTGTSLRIAFVGSFRKKTAW